eukprot:CAMPEP_0183331758 /NCGR_PEP_ID=MMETSP0164_2-20130417/1084_1 /TAXON_ID=221442 /ORGANISM="Coccolithus pelagicus ssp braarudi, Strain PLY182g" /LENGTH=44 /DNA_ID= /DNA_START= /DNA_END= /DNA_ORIENTATION=
MAHGKLGVDQLPVKRNLEGAEPRCVVVATLNLDTASKLTCDVRL